MLTDPDTHEGKETVGGILREMKNMVENENDPLTPYSEALCILT